MNSEEKFKQSLKDLLETKEFLFDEANWEKAEKVIAENKKRKIWPFIFSALILLISGVLSFAFFNSTQENHGNYIAEKGGENLLKETIKENKSNTSIISKVSANGHSSEIDEDKLINQKEKTQGEVIKDSEKTNSSSTIFKQTAKESIRVSLQIKKQKTAEGQIISSNTIPVDLTNQNQETEKTKKVLDSNSKSEMNDFTLTETKENDNKILASISKEPLVFEDKLNYVLLPQIKTKLENPLSENDKIILKDSIAFRNVDFINEFKRSNYFSMEAGSSYLLGWKNSDIREANGFNPLVGINYHSQVSQRTVLSIGIQYSSASNLSFNSHTSTVTKYGLGEETAVTIITPNKLHYLVAPLKLEYTLNPKNCIGFGFNAAYLLTVQSKVETYNEGYNITKANYTSSKTNGYTQGFSPFDIQGSVFYKRRLYKNLFLNTEFVYGLTDIKDNTFFKSKIVERNCGLKLSLVYNLFKR